MPKRKRRWIRRCWTLVFESSGNPPTVGTQLSARRGRADQSAALLGLLMLRGPQTAGELRINAERWHRFADISSVEGFLDELQNRSAEKAGRWSCCCRVRPARARAALGAPAVRAGHPARRA